MAAQHYLGPDSVAPALTGTVLIAAFEGWNDAGGAASAALAHLSEIWNARQVAELDPEEYYDYQVNRPIISAGEDGARVTDWPATTVSVANLGNRQIVLVAGIEPSMRWRRYCQELLDIATKLKVDSVITIGALLADAPHTRPLPITATSEDKDVREVFGLENSDYSGPTGIVGVLQQAAIDAGFEALSVWATVPHYVANPPSPKATLGLLEKISELLYEPVELGDYPEAAETWLHNVATMTSEDADIAEYVAQLEEHHDTIEAPEATGDAIAKEFESWLKRRDGE